MAEAVPQAWLVVLQVVAGATSGLVNMLLVFAPNTGTGVADGLNAVAKWTGGQVCCCNPPDLCTRTAVALCSMQLTAKDILGVGLVG